VEKFVTGGHVNSRNQSLSPNDKAEEREPGNDGWSYQYTFFRIRYFPTSLPNKGTQGVHELFFFCEYKASRSSSILIRLVHQVWLRYTAKQKNLFHLKKCNISLVLSRFDSNNSISALFIRTSMELFPARQLNVMQSKIVANGRIRLVGNFLWTHSITRSNKMLKHGLILLPALIRYNFSGKPFQINIAFKRHLTEKTLLKVKQLDL